MIRLRVAVVLGTRPEAIKLAPVVRCLRSEMGVQTVVISSGQHGEMLRDALGLFGIEPDVDLDVMEDDQTPTTVASRVLAALENVLAAERYAWLVVQGDTTTVLAATLAGVYARVRVAHVEAGLRSYDASQPFPEELNRVAVSHLATLHLAPTARARDNLLREGIPGHRIVVTGNTVVDALRAIADGGWQPEPSHPLALLPLDRRWVLVTAHRRESFGAGIERICTALVSLAGRGDVEILYPVHPNPAVRKPVEELLGSHPRITLLPPLDYRTLVWLLVRCVLVLTDSGGLQEEAPSLGRPVLVLRDKTERPEAVEAGVARVVGTDPVRIVSEAEALLDDPRSYAQMARAVDVFGDGHAAERVVEAVLGFDQ